MNDLMKDAFVKPLVRGNEEYTPPERNMVFYHWIATMCCENP